MYLIIITTHNTIVHHHQLQYIQFNHHTIISIFCPFHIPPTIPYIPTSPHPSLYVYITPNSLPHTHTPLEPTMSAPSSSIYPNPNVSQRSLLSPSPAPSYHPPSTSNLIPDPHSDAESTRARHALEEYKKRDGSKGTITHYDTRRVRRPVRIIVTIQPEWAMMAAPRPTVYLLTLRPGTILSSVLSIPM